MLKFMNADLAAQIPAGPGFVDAAQGWLQGVLDEIIPDLLEGLRERPVRRRVSIRNSGRPWGEPGQVRGVLRVGVDDPLPRREVPFSDAAWQQMVGSLARYPEAVWVEVWPPLGENGFPRGGRSVEGWGDVWPPPGGGGESAHVWVRRPIDGPGWVRFTFSVPAGHTGWPGSAELQDRWAGFVKRQAARIGACGVGMTDDRPPGHSTALEDAALHCPVPVLERDRRAMLLGYSWVTIVPAGLAARLGGARALAETGAFCEVSALPDGSLWLRATPTVSEFTGERVRRVFEALAPVLLPGKTIFLGTPLRLVEGVDAADYQDEPVWSPGSHEPPARGAVTMPGRRRRRESGKRPDLVFDDDGHVSVRMKGPLGQTWTIRPGADDPVAKVRQMTVTVTDRHGNVVANSPDDGPAPPAAD